MPARLDAIDRHILKELQADGRITNVELARRVGISAPPCLRRVRALEEAGFIKGYRGLIDEKMLGFEVTAFDISPTAIEWAKRLHADTEIQFEVADLFEPYRGWLGSFDFVLEVYTIQPLPMELRIKAIDAIATFVAPGGEIVVVCRGRDDDEETPQLPWPLSRADLSRFEDSGLAAIDFSDFIDDDDTRRFVVLYKRPA